jgi:hypothetical protein
VVKSENGANGGIGFWVRPVREGREIQRFVPAGADKFEDAATCAADTAYLHIIDDAAHLLPLWARWSSEEAFAAYMDAIESMAHNRDISGAEHLDNAASQESTNLLIRLQFANLLERTVSAHEDEACRRALKYARALNAYLRVAKLEPTVVEARYRASVLAAMLASCIVKPEAPYLPTVREALPMIQLPSGPPGGDADNGEAAASTLSDLSRSESNAVLQLLRPWYTLLRQGRLRHQLEMAGMDRRRLRNTVRISRHCVWLRERKRRIPWYVAPRVLWRWVVVRWIVYRSVGWHGHYNAACFDALLFQRRRERWRAAGQANPPNGWLLRFLQRGALNHLSIAIHDSKGALAWEWVDRDPDLAEVRDENDPDWQILAERYRGNGKGKPGDPWWVGVRGRATHLVDEMSQLRGHPDRPWGAPARRHYAWSVLAIGLAVLVVALAWAGAAESVRLLTALAVLGALATLRAVLLARETWRTWSVEPESEGDAVIWDERSYWCRSLVFALGLVAVMDAALTHHFVWQVPFALASFAVLAIVWAVVAAKQAVRFADAAAQAAKAEAEAVPANV